MEMELHIGDRKVLNTSSLPLSVTQEETKVGFTGTKPDGLYTLLMRDPDAPNSDYLHLLIVNGPYNLPTAGAIVLDYLPPQAVGHRYLFEVYLQSNPITPMIQDRSEFYLPTFAQIHGLQLEGRIMFTTTS
jgi:phosphatidylethanolamine-binding protein (PEBP) family uncharacterized protein